MIVCICHRVSDRDIVSQARLGKNFDDIQGALGVASCCGRCEDCVRQMLQDCQPCIPAQDEANSMVAPNTTPIGQRVIPIHIVAM